MWPLPVELLNEYRMVTISNLVRSWSFGEVKSVRKSVSRAWADWGGTLQDEGIFGPTRNFECACGLFSGKQYEGMICHVCRVKITTVNSRRTRFAHIELPVPEQHPFGRSTDKLQAFPVIPAAFFESVAGGRLADAYDSLVTAATGRSQPETRAAVDQIVEVLLPITIEAQSWNLQDAETLARGLALERLDAEAPDERCLTCGYALAGLAVSRCPGCGRQLNG